MITITKSLVTFILICVLLLVSTYVSLAQQEHDTWHEPTTHEHGDPVPSWANEWLIANNEQPFVYGGVERSSPLENVLKHECFKGASTTNADNSVEGYLRYHGCTNALDHNQFHSVKAIMRDAAGNVILFMQGHIDAGTERISATQQQGFGRGINPLTRILFVVDQLAFDLKLRTEVWYPEPGPYLTALGMGKLDMAFYIESTTIHNTDKLTGVKGLRRVIEFWWQPPRSGLVTGWFCTTLDGMIADCDEPETLRQYISPNIMQHVKATPSGQRIFTVNKTYERIGWPCPACGFPN